MSNDHVLDARVSAPACPWNPRVDCSEQSTEACRRCGWNFVVAYERKKHLRETGAIPKIWRRSETQ